MRLCEIGVDNNTSKGVKMTTPEGVVKRKLDRMLSQVGVWYFSPQAGPHGRAGIPDRIACAHGRFIGIEAKADATKSPTRLQKSCMSQIEAAGGTCFVVYDDDTIEVVRRYLVEDVGC